MLFLRWERKSKDQISLLQGSKTQLYIHLHCLSIQTISIFDTQQQDGGNPIGPKK